MIGEVDSDALLEQDRRLAKAGRDDMCCLGGEDVIKK